MKSGSTYSVVGAHLLPIPLVVLVLVPLTINFFRFFLLRMLSYMVKHGDISVTRAYSFYNFIYNLPEK